MSGRSPRDSDSEDKATPSKRRRGLFDLLDALRPTPRETRPRPAREANFKRKRPVPPSAQDLAASERLRRR